MPFKRRRRNAGRGRRRKAPKRYSNIKSIIKRTLNRASETKYLADEEVEQSIATSTLCTVFNAIADVSTGGADVNSAVGLKFKGIGLHLNYFIKSSTDNEDQYFRVIVISAGDGLYNDTTGKYLQNVTGATDEVFTADDLTDILRPLAKNKFKVLYDRTHMLSAKNLGHGRSNAWVKKLIKFNHNRNHTGSADEADKGNLRLILVNRNINNDAVATAAEITFYTKYYFKDL